MKQLLLYIFIFIGFKGKAQINLVPNWSFETIIDCTFNTNGDITKATPWFAAKSVSSTDLFNVCDTTFYHVPNNFLGYQYAKSGNGYTGLIPFQYPNSTTPYREYAEVKLIDSLRSGKSYCVTFYVNPANNMGFSSCYINSLGAVFSYDTLRPLPDSLLIDTIPDISSPTIISDTINWTSIAGVYSCTNTKKFITLGNFYDDNNTTYVCVLQNGSYYHIDDVSVVEVSNANAGNDTAMCAGNTASIGGLPTFDAEYIWYELADSANSSSIDSINIARPHISPTQTTTYVMWKRQCNVITTDTVNVVVNCVGIKEHSSSVKHSLYPNPNNGMMQAEVSLKNNEKGTLEIYTLSGLKLSTYDLKAGNNSFTIDESKLQAGVYIYHIVINGAIKESKKLIIIK